MVGMLHFDAFSVLQGEFAVTKSSSYRRVLALLDQSIRSAAEADLCQQLKLVTLLRLK